MPDKTNLIFCSASTPPANMEYTQLSRNDQMTAASRECDRADVQADAVRRLVQQTFQKYVSQLLLGCGNEHCSEVLCHTGRVNTSPGPIRRYTIRAARQVALAMCSDPQRIRHLCSYMPEGRGQTETNWQETRLDPTSLPQLLCDTNSIKYLFSSVPSIRLDSELARLHQSVSKVLRVAGHLPTLDGFGYLSNAQIADELLPCFQWLISKMPLQRTGPWRMVNRDIVSKGYAYPTKHENLPADDKYNSWLIILDSLEHEPHLRLLERVMMAISARHALEYSLFQIDKKEGERFVNFENSVEFEIGQRLYAETTSTARLAVVVWLKKLFTKVWDSCPIVEHGDVCFGVLQTMKAMAFCQLKMTPFDWPEDTFCMPVVLSRLDLLELAEHFKTIGPKKEHILSWNFLFSQAELSIVFRVINHDTMSQANAGVGKACSLRRRLDVYQYTLDEDLPPQIQHAEKHYLLLMSSRGHALSDAFDQLWQRRADELRRPLRVRLGEIDEFEVGHDLGGVQIEFFNLICKEAFAEEAGMFTTEPTTGYSYFRPGSLQPLHMFETLGLLIALALYNGITVPICLPSKFYWFLSHPSPTSSGAYYSPDDIQDAFPVIARSLRSILEDDIPGLEYSYPLEANGLRLTVLQPAQRTSPKHRKCMTVSDATSTGDGSRVDIASIRSAWPGWKITKASPNQQIIEVTAEHKVAYVAGYVNFLVYGSVAPQVDAFLQGFHSANLFHETRALSLFTPDQLKAHAEGVSRLDIDELKEATKYDGYEARSKYMHSFWRIVSAWSAAKQKQLLKFVTAAERIPITGAKHLTFIIKKAAPESMESLPTSSTCFGTLMLPRYPTAVIMEAKLNLALKYGSEGFGTG